MVIGYKYDGIANLLSDKIKTTVYHELTHAAQYNQLGDGWYTNFVNSEIAEIVATYITNKQYRPYGTGGDGLAPIIALGESWAYYIGHYFANKTYGFNSSDVKEQGITYQNHYPLSNLSSHLNLLEDFNPFRTYDVFHWIPQGLFYDLNDTRNDNSFNSSAVIDQVSNFSNQQMFNAFSYGITTLQNYRANFIRLNPNNQTSQLTTLFSQYGY